MLRANRRGAAGGRGFTLTELLVVIAIMGILAVMSVPAFTGIARGGKMKSSIAQVRTTLALARQYAITHRENTYVVFATNTAMAMRGFGVFTWASGYVKEWTLLPEGIVFDKDIADSQFTNILGGAAASTFPVRFPDLTSGVTQDMPCVVFQPDGRLRQTSNTKLLIGLSDGSVDTNTCVVSLVPQGMRFGIGVYPLTGQFRVKEYTVP